MHKYLSSTQRERMQLNLQKQVHDFTQPEQVRSTLFPSKANRNMSIEMSTSYFSYLGPISGQGLFKTSKPLISVHVSHAS